MESMYLKGLRMGNKSIEQIHSLITQEICDKNQVITKDDLIEILEEKEREWLKRNKES